MLPYQTTPTVTIYLVCHTCVSWVHFDCKYTLQERRGIKLSYHIQLQFSFTCSFEMLNQVVYVLVQFQFQLSSQFFYVVYVRSVKQNYTAKQQLVSSISCSKLLSVNLLHLCDVNSLTKLFHWSRTSKEIKADS